MMEQKEYHSSSTHLYNSWHICVFLGLIECIAFVCAALGQVYSPPTHAAIIYSSETVWAILGGYVYLNEGLSSSDAIGCVLLVGATLCAKLDVVEGIKRCWRRGVPCSRLTDI